MQRTLSLIKPDAVAKNNMGAIMHMLEEGDLRIVCAKMVRLNRAQAEGFYAVHKERPFFASLCDFMTSGPIMALVLEGDDAIAKYRTIMGATNPADAAEGTIRKRFASNIERNACHGSDAPETAAVEIPYFFTEYELNGLA